MLNCWQWVRATQRRAGGTESASFSTSFTSPSSSPTSLYIPQHLNHRRRQWRHRTPDSQCRAPTYTHGRQPRAKMLKQLQCSANFLTRPFFFSFSFFYNIWWPVARLPLPTQPPCTKHPGSRDPACNNTQPRPSGCFYTVINWWLDRVSVQLRVKSTARGVIH